MSRALWRQLPSSLALALPLVACIVLNAPITPVDVSKAALAGRLPYLSAHSRVPGRDEPPLSSLRLRPVCLPRNVFQYPISNIRFPIPNIPQFPISDFQYPISNLRFPISNIQFPSGEWNIRWRHVNPSRDVTCLLSEGRARARRSSCTHGQRVPHHGH